MAVTTEAANLVKQKVRIALAGANPCIALQFKGLWQWLATHKAGTDLTFAAFADLTADTAVEDEACKVYAIYVKKGATATDAFYKVFDDASDDTTLADGILCIPLLTASEEAVYVQPDGLDLTTGLVHGSYAGPDDYNATTASTSGDGPDGFIVYGAP